MRLSHLSQRRVGVLGIGRLVVLRRWGSDTRKFGLSTELIT